jgi:CCR4-NOT transcriptional regulation complex NOT5 subunit
MQQARNENTRLMDALKCFLNEQRAEEQRHKDAANRRQDHMANVEVPKVREEIDRAGDTLRDFRKDRMKMAQSLGQYSEKRVEDFKPIDDMISDVSSRIEIMKQRLVPALQRFAPTSSLLYGTQQSQQQNTQRTLRGSVSAAALPSSNASSANVGASSRGGMATSVTSASALPPISNSQTTSRMSSRTIGASASMSSLPTISETSGLLPPIYSSSASVTDAGGASQTDDDLNWHHPGQWRKHRNTEYWTCCQTPSTGSKNAKGCQPRNSE